MAPRLESLSKNRVIEPGAYDGTHCAVAGAAAAKGGAKETAAPGAAAGWAGGWACSPGAAGGATAGGAAPPGGAGARMDAGTMVPLAIPATRSARSLARLILPEPGAPTGPGGPGWPGTRGGGRAAPGTAVARTGWVGPPGAVRFDPAVRPANSCWTTSRAVAADVASLSCWVTTGASMISSQTSKSDSMSGTPAPRRVRMRCAAKARRSKKSSQYNFALREESWETTLRARRAKPRSASEEDRPKPVPHSSTRILPSSSMARGTSTLYEDSAELPHVPAPWADLPFVLG